MAPLSATARRTRRSRTQHRLGLVRFAASRRDDVRHDAVEDAAGFRHACLVLCMCRLPLSAEAVGRRDVGIEHPLRCAGVDRLSRHHDARSMYARARPRERHTGVDQDVFAVGGSARRERRACGPRSPSLCRFSPPRARSAACPGLQADVVGLYVAAVDLVHRRRRAERHLVEAVVTVHDERPAVPSRRSTCDTCPPSRCHRHRGAVAAPAGLVSGPSELKMVRMPISRRAVPTKRIAGWNDCANMKPKPACSMTSAPAPASVHRRPGPRARRLRRPRGDLGCRASPRARRHRRRRTRPPSRR